jgi:hypothetical protein
MRTSMPEHRDIIRVSVRSPKSNSWLVKFTVYFFGHSEYEQCCAGSTQRYQVW